MQFAPNLLVICGRLESSKEAKEKCQDDERVEDEHSGIERREVRRNHPSTDSKRQQVEAEKSDQLPLEKVLCRVAVRKPTPHTQRRRSENSKETSDACNVMLSFLLAVSLFTVPRPSC